MEQQVTTGRQVHVIPATRPVAGNSNRRNHKKRVAAYCRVSTNAEEQINSYKAQKSYYTQLIEENPDWEMAGVFADEGLSGVSTKKRKEFNRMIAACKRGSIDLILTKSLSRFARNTVDCLETVRKLKAMGIGVIFEKENINTLTETSEFLITLFSSFAQAESESLSKNVAWGHQKSMEAGNVPFRKMLGYRKGEDDKPKIVPEEAEIVRRIYRRYLEGASFEEIKNELVADNIPTSESIKAWSGQAIRRILINERYIGDALLQKTYIADCISKRAVKNQGERPMYYVENNHEAIIPKSIFQMVQVEMTRRASKRKVMQKSGKTEQGKYSAKYALSEILVCGECGTPYKRCTWAKYGKKRIVWRCISRLEYGKMYCHNSPTMDEEKLHQAIIAALNAYGAIRDEVEDGALALAEMACSQGEKNGENLLILQQKLDVLIKEQNMLVDKVMEDMDNEILNNQLKAISKEKQILQDQIEEQKKVGSSQSVQESRTEVMAKFLAQQPMKFTEYDDTLTRRLVEQITVVDPETIRIKIKDSEVVLEQKFNE